MKKPSPKSKIIAPRKAFQPILPPFKLLAGRDCRDYAEHELVAHLAEKRGAWTAMDERRDAVFGQIGEDIERLNDQEPDAGSQGKAEQPRAPRGHSELGSEQAHPQRGPGRPKDMTRLLNDVIIVDAFEWLTKLTNRAYKRRINRSFALFELAKRWKIPKQTLYKKRDRLKTFARSLGKT